MTDLKSLKEKIEDWPNMFSDGKTNFIPVRDVLDLIDKYAEQEPNLEKLKDKLHDKIEIHVCEVEENTLIAQGMLKALGMVDEVLENAEKGGE